MPENRYNLESLWQRLQDAKLQLDFAFNYVKEIHADKLSGAIPAPDGYYAHGNALRGEKEALERYINALEEFRAALGLNGASQATHEAVEITPREKQVLALIAGGKTSKEIAAQLGIAFRTAVCHRYRIQTKLNAHNTADLTRAAIRMGLVSA